MGGRRRGKGDDDDDYPAYSEPPPAQLQRLLSADQSAAAGATFGGMPAVPMPHYVSRVSRSTTLDTKQAPVCLNTMIRPELSPRLPPVLLPSRR